MRIALDVTLIVSAGGIPDGVDGVVVWRKTAGFSLSIETVSASLPIDDEVGLMTLIRRRSLRKDGAKVICSNLPERGLEALWKHILGTTL